MIKHEHDCENYGCDYTCHTYSGYDLNSYLLWHMDGDFLDTIMLPKKDLRDMVVKFWDKLTPDVRDKWKNFKKTSSGIGKFHPSELKSDPELSEKYHNLLNSL